MSRTRIATWPVRRIAMAGPRRRARPGAAADRMAARLGADVVARCRARARGRATEVLHAHLVGDEVGLAVGADIEMALLRQGEGPRADAAEHRDLVPGLVDAAVAVEAFRQRGRGMRGRVPG